MPDISRVTGVRSVIRNLRGADERYARGVARGLKKGGLYTQRESQKRVPVEFGPLKASAFTRAEGNGFGTHVTVGYTVAYAAFVHEAVGMVLQGLPRTPNPPHKGNYWDPQGRGQAKFLENVIREDQKKISQIVKDEAFRAKWS